MDTLLYEIIAPESHQLAGSCIVLRLVCREWSSNVPRENLLSRVEYVGTHLTSLAASDGWYAGLFDRLFEHRKRAWLEEGPQRTTWMEEYRTNKDMPREFYAVSLERIYYKLVKTHIRSDAASLESENCSPCEAWARISQIVTPMKTAETMAIYNITTALVKHGRVHLLRYFEECDPSLVNYWAIRVHTICAAIERGHFDMMQYLLANPIDWKRASVFLHRAINCKKLEIARLFARYILDRAPTDLQELLTFLAAGKEGCEYYLEYFPEQIAEYCDLAEKCMAIVHGQEIPDFGDLIGQIQLARRELIGIY